MPPDLRQFATDAGELMRNLTDQVVRQLLGAWFLLDTYHHKDIPSFVDTATPIVLSGQEVATNLAHNYVDSQWRTLGWAPPPYPTDATGAAIRNGVGTATVYARPFVDVYQALDRGAGLDAAIHSGATRLRELASTDIQLVHDHAVRDMYRRSNRGYRRVLVGATNCALCIIASTQRYRRGDLMPMHPHCNCKTEPITDDTGHVLGGDLLDAVHREIADRFGISDAAARRIDYRRVLLTRDHGEYGPTLTYARDLFTGPDDITTTKSAPRRARPPGGKTL